MIEYFLFCTDDRPLEIATLVTTLHDAGWTLRIFRNWLVADAFQLVTHGYIENEDVAIGWPIDSALGADFEAALSRGERGQLDAWVSEYQLGSAMWAVQSPFNFTDHSEFESVNDAREQMGERYADHVSKAKCMYLLSNCQHMEFTAVIIGAAAMLRNGVIEDAQMGLCIPAPANASELSHFWEIWYEE